MVQILEAPFTFRRRGYEPRSRREVETTLVGRVPMKVAEMSGDEAPLAGRCRYLDMRLAPGAGGGPPVWEEHWFETDYRMVGGRLARRATADRSFLAGGSRELPVGIGNRATRGAFAAWMADPSRIGVAHAQAALETVRLSVPLGAEPIAPRLPGRRVPNTWSVRMEEDDGFSRREGDDRDLRSGQETAALRGRMAFVDGDLYLPSAGPAWDMRGGRAAGPGRIHLASKWTAHAVPEASWLSDEAVREAFLPGDEGALRAFAEATHGLDGLCGDMEAIGHGSFEMHPDELAVRSEATEAVAEAAGSFFLARRDPAGLRAIADCMSMLDSDGPCAPVLRQALAAFAARWDAGLPADSSLRWRSEGTRRLAVREAARVRALGTDADVLPGPAAP